MSVTQITETRNFTRLLEYSRETVLPGIIDNSKDKKPLVSIMTGALATPMFGGVGMQGQGKRMKGGGESIVTKLRIGQNTTMKALTGGYDTFDTSPQSNVIHGRANWKLYGGTVSISGHEIQTNSGGFGHADIVDEEMRSGVEDLVDDVSNGLYAGQGGIETSDLSQLISANDSIYGVSGATYSRWNSRGVSARGTAAASISFAGGSFATTGLSNWRLAWENAAEGTEEPQALLTTHSVKTFYEGSLQPQERFNNARMADGGFRFLEFKTAPVIADPDCTSQATYFLNFNHLYLCVLEGADFASGPFQEPDAQRVQISKLFFTGELITDNRTLQNKVLSQTA